MQWFATLKDVFIRNKFFATLSLCLLAEAGYAAHPLVTDDTGTQNQGNSQIEINTDWARQNGSNSRVAAFTYSFGLQDNLDAIINLPATYSSPSGINDLSLGVKWRFIENGPMSFAFKPELLLPTGDAGKGLGNGRTSMALTWIGSYDAAPWIFHGNLGVIINRYQLQTDHEANRRAVWRASGAVWYLLNEQWKLVADVGAAHHSSKASDNPVYFLTGLIYSPNENLDLDIGVKFGIGCGQCQTSLDRQLGVGLTSRF